VIARGRPCARTVFVAAVAAIAIGVAPRAIAQDVRDAPWWHELQVPDGPTQTALLRNVQATPALVFDPDLPAIPLDAWLWQTLAPLLNNVPLQLVDWNLTLCLDPLSTIPDLGSQLCATGTVRLSADRNVQIVILVADGVPGPRLIVDGVPGPTAGPPHWRATSPALRDVYIERVKDSRPIDSLDVPALGALPQLLNRPFEQWPTVGFETAIAWDPPAPAPGDTVRFSISIRNPGKRAAVRASITIVITTCCGNDEFRHEWSPLIAAGQAVFAGLAIPLPDGRAMAMVEVRPLSRDKVVRESDEDKPSALALIGYPPLPR
jgi:hypothetical protein